MTTGAVRSRRTGTAADHLPTDALSGVERTEVEVRVDGSPWRQSSGRETLPAGSVVRFRARARDNAMNVGSWVESRDVIVQRAPEPAATPVATVTATPSPAPTATPAPKRAVKLRGLVARHARGRLVIRGRLAPASATGRIEARAGRRRLRATVRRGRFLMATRTARPPRRVTLRYPGDSRHSPTARRVRVR